MKAGDLLRQFTNIYGPGRDTVQVYFAPGRVNLIGEHTDYNDGFVLPCALSYGTYLAIRKTTEPFLEFHSEGFDYSARVPLDSQFVKSGKEWVNYPVGVIEMFRQKGKLTGGLQFYYSGNIPAAAGLSSSASIEMVTAFAINDIYNWDYSVLDLIHLSKKAENEYIGVNCGIMDQFAVGEGKKGHAIFLNCDTLAFDHVPLNIPGYRLVITNTNKKRGLGDSKYNERVEECAKAVGYLSKKMPLKSLGKVTFEDFETHKALITDETVLKRARHVVTENQRVVEAVRALRDSDFQTFGQLMIQSHASLRNDYEVTGYELDSLVDIMLAQQGVLGARMTGAGFGGCTVAFVKHDHVDGFISGVSDAYKQKTGLTADFYLPDVDDGVKRID